MRNNKSILKIIIRCIEIIILLIGIFFAGIIVTQRISNNENAFLGYRLYIVETGSMIPVYNIGDVIMVKEIDFENIKIDDDVSYIATSGKLKGSVVTHRVIELTEDSDGEKAIITQGVANTVSDGLIYPEQITGVVIRKLNILSWICGKARNLYILYFVIVVPLTIYIFFNLIKANRKSWEREEKNK